MIMSLHIFTHNYALSGLLFSYALKKYLAEFLHFSFYSPLYSSSEFVIRERITPIGNCRFFSLDITRLYISTKIKNRNNLLGTPKFTGSFKFKPVFRHFSNLNLLGFQNPGEGYNII